jgi:hypothetical protein
MIGKSGYEVLTILDGNLGALESSLRLPRDDAEIVWIGLGFDILGCQNLEHMSLVNFK